MQKRNKIAAKLLATIANTADHTTEFKIAANKFDKLFRERILDICIGRVRSFSRSGVEADSEEVCQDAFLKILKRASQFDPKKGDIMAWIYRIVNNELLELLRKKDNKLFDVKVVPLSNRMISTLAIVVQKESIGPVRPDWRAEAKKKEIRKIKAALKSLSKVQEDIMLTKLKFAPADMPREERERIATTYGIKESSIKTYWMRAKRAIEKALGQKVNWQLFESIDNRSKAC